MTTTIQEPAQTIPVAGVFDVIVVGGGIAGVAAAVAAARRGARTALIEKEYGLGGLATLGNILVYLPLCDGMGRQVIGGIAEELLKLSARDVVAAAPQMTLSPIPDCWQSEASVEDRREKRYVCRFNPASLMLEMEALIVREGVTLFYDTRFCCCIKSNNLLSHVIVENKSGRLALQAGAFVDASGDADLCAAAGEESEALDSNVLCGWNFWTIDGQVKLQVLSNPYDSQCGKGNGARGPFFCGHKGKDVTQHVLASRQLLREKLETLRRENPDKAIYPFQLATIASLRATRRLRSRFSLGEQHVHQWFDDTIALTGDWRKNGPVYALPYRTIHGESTANLFVAGRCISADTTVWDVTRVIPTCAVTGEAAGAAAAISALEHQGDGDAVDIAALQQYLRAQGGLLEPELVTRAQPLALVTQTD